MDLSFFKDMKKGIDSSGFPKEYIDYITSVFNRDGYILGVHRSLSLPEPFFTKGIKNYEGSDFTNTVFYSSELLSTINYCIPDDSHITTVLVEIPESCFYEENPTPLFYPLDHESDSGSKIYTIDPSFILGAFSKDPKGNFTFASNTPSKDTPLGSYSDTHDYGKLVPMDDSDRIGKYYIGKKWNSLEELYKHDHPIKYRLSKIKEFFKKKAPIPSLPASPFSNYKANFVPKCDEPDVGNRINYLNQKGKNIPIDKERNQ